MELSQLIGQAITPGNTLVIFDEIQACPAAITALKRIQETANEYHVACAGSLLGLALYRDAQYSFPGQINARRSRVHSKSQHAVAPVKSTVLQNGGLALASPVGVGKVDIVNMYPMNFKEFLMATERENLADMIGECFDADKELSPAMHELALEQYRTYLTVGGMPECVLEYVSRKDFDFVKAKQLAICEMYANDMVKYCTRTEARQRGTSVLKDLGARLKNIAAYNSVVSQLAKENRKFQFNLIQSGARAKDYADALFWLEKANIVIKVPKINEGKMPLAGYEDLLSFKIYFNDVGLFSAKSNLVASAILTQNYGGEVKGALTENYVAEELVANGIRPYYWESRGTAELDCLRRVRSTLRQIPYLNNNRRLLILLSSNKTKSFLLKQRLISTQKQKASILSAKNTTLKNQFVYLPKTSVLKMELRVFRCTLFGV
jgi:predicted AAA+ superfamily ATPase